MPETGESHHWHSYGLSVRTSDGNPLQSIANDSTPKGSELRRSREAVTASTGCLHRAYNAALHGTKIA